MRKKIVVFGAGGMGKDAMWQLNELNKTLDVYDILGFADDAPVFVGKTLCGHRILGGTDWLVSYPDEINVVIAIANPKLRKSKFEEISRNPNTQFPSIIAHDAKFSEYASLGQGCLVCALSIVSPGAVLGDFVIAHYHSTVGHDSSLGDYVTLYPGVNISGYVNIGDFCEIGTGTCIIQGKAIGENSILGAGSTVINDIPENCTAVGMPARKIKPRNE